MTLQRLPFDGVAVQLYANPEGSPLWDQATWGGETWPLRSWQDVSLQILQASYSWGANRALGVLSVAAGGSFSLETYDPNRLLDPTNTSAPFASDLLPGSYMRLVYQGTPICFAILDSIDYDNQAQQGRIAGTDPVGTLSNVKVDTPSSPATTLRAYARQLIAATVYTAVSVEPDPPEGDPLIGEPSEIPTEQIGVWQSISAAAQDSLHYAWVAADLVVRFRSHGEPIDRGLALGFGGIPVVQLLAHSNADGIINRVTARDLTGPVVPVVNNASSQQRFGVQAVDRTERKVPDAAVWAQRVIDDRAFASLEYIPSLIWPTTPEQLMQLAGMGGIETVRLRLDVPEPDVSTDARSLGLSVSVSEAGWTAAVLCYVSSSEWIINVTPPPPDVPTPPATQQVTRSYTSTKSARVSLTNTGAKYGAGAELANPAGYWDGWQNRMLVEFPTLNLADALEVVSATLRLRTSDQSNVGFGSTPKVRVQRITTSWSEGTSGSPSGSNAVIWPGPTRTATHEAVKSVTRSELAQVDIDVTAIVKDWAPAAAGGSGIANRGLAIIGYSETSLAYTSEFCSDDYGTSTYRPQLIVVLKIPA
jgi:hypothetical protein